MQAQAAYGIKATFQSDLCGLVFAKTVIMMNVLFGGLAAHEAPYASEKKTVFLNSMSEKTHIVSLFTLFSLPFCSREYSSYRGLLL